MAFKDWLAGAGLRPRADRWFGSDPFRPTSTTGFEAAQRTRRLAKFNASKDHVNVMLAAAGETLVARSRHLVRNSGYAANATEAFTAHAVGTGIKPNPGAVFDPETRKAVLEAWRFWCAEADADGLTDFYGLQKRIAREVFIAGEAFVRLRARRPEDGLFVPFQLQVLPSEMLDTTYNGPSDGTGTIRNGVEFDLLGRRVAYHFFRVHPGDAATPEQGTRGERVRVPASEVLHIYDPLEAGQVRGVPKLAPAIVKLFMLDLYDDAELERKKTAAMFAAFVKRTGDTDPFQTDPDDDPEAAPGTGLVPMEAGLIQYLDEGEDITFSSPADVGGMYEAFQYRTLLQISAALGVPYPYLTGDMMKANYSNTRASLIDFRRRMETFQWTVMVFAFCRPVWARWLRTAQLAGAISLPDLAARERLYTNCEWFPPKWDWVDPMKDAQAEVLQISAGLKSRSMALTERGYDPEQVDEEIAADRAREKLLGLTFAEGGPPPPPPEQNEEDDGTDPPPPE